MVNEFMNNGSKDVVKAAIMMSLTADRAEEKALKTRLAKSGIKTAAVDYGGEFINSIMKIVERAVVSSKREGVIEECHNEEGAVAGAAGKPAGNAKTLFKCRRKIAQLAR